MCSNTSTKTDGATPRFSANALGLDPAKSNAHSSKLLLGPGVHVKLTTSSLKVAYSFVAEPLAYRTPLPYQEHLVRSRFEYEGWCARPVGDGVRSFWERVGHPWLGPSVLCLNHAHCNSMPECDGPPSGSIFALNVHGNGACYVIFDGSMRIAMPVLQQEECCNITRCMCMQAIVASHSGS